MNFVSRRLLAGIFATSAAALLLVSCGGSDSVASSVQAGVIQRSNDGKTSTIIDVTDNAFSPQTAVVPVNTKVTWRWVTKNKHSVVGAFGSHEISTAQMKSGRTFSVTMNEPGVFEYQCGVHGSSMTGRVRVE